MTAARFAAVCEPVRFCSGRAAGLQMALVCGLVLSHQICGDPAAVGHLNTLGARPGADIGLVMTRCASADIAAIRPRPDADCGSVIHLRVGERRVRIENIAGGVTPVSPARFAARSDFPLIVGDLLRRRP